MKHKGFYGTLVLVVVVLGGWYLHQRPVTYQADHTIRTGQLRATTFALVSSAENASTNYRHQYGYIQDIGDGRGYTAGIIGFTTGTGDLLAVVQRYTQRVPKNKLAAYIPALKRVNGTASHRGLGPKFVTAWRRAAKDKRFIQAQDAILNRQYLRPVLAAAKRDNLGPLGQYIYYDAIVVHGPGSDATSFGGIRRIAQRHAKTPAQGGDQAHYLRTFLHYRGKVMRQEAAHHDLSRLTAQRRLIHQRNFALKRPLHWTMYGDTYQLN